MKNSPRPAAGPSFHTGALLLASFILLAGCGGGGSGGVGVGEKTCVDTALGCLEKEAYNAAVLDAAEGIRSSPGFDDRWALEEIRLAEAWGHLQTVRGSERPGLGVTVGVLDTGIDLEHRSFVEGVAAGDVTEQFFSGATDETGEDGFSHGTGVASIIAGRENPDFEYQHTGIVPYARLKALAIPLGDAPPPDFAISAISLSGLAQFDESWADLYRRILSPDLDVLNLSFGVFGPIENYQGEVVRGFAQLSGTSFSAPMVTGGLALMKQFFRDQLASEELVTRLFETADKNGRFADRSVYGQGMMDLDAALSPYGEPTVMPGDGVLGTGIPLKESSLRLGTAFGDGPASAFSRQEIATFDTLGAPFWYDLGRLVVAPGPPLLDTQLRDFMEPLPHDRQEEAAEWNGNTALAGMRFDMRRTPAWTGNGHALLPDDAVTFTARRLRGIATTAFTTEGVGENPRPVSGASIAWRPASSPLGLRAGWLNERGSMLSSTGQGAFGNLAADSVFVGFDLSAETGGWRLGGGPEFGMVRPSLDEGIITSLEPLATSAFAFHASRPVAGAGALLLVSLTQPLRVEAGDAVLSIPTGRTRDGGILRRQFTADLAPTGRQIDLSVRWERPLGAGSLRLGTIATRHAGHDEKARPRLSLLAGWRASF
ncbi:MAG: S8 family serine peptidase [Gammaproteobacteria bacterium]|nr:S8 family serine peptidase [Gammaproteobacteria bacterium]MYG66497.1 S8 family serine peptidase [Gammaproteobacteria bacterium]